MSEIITRVDEHDHVIGGCAREEFDGDWICRTSHLYIFNTRGELLIQKRALSKENYPGLYDTSVSGTVRYGESYEQTVEREMREELGISIPYTWFNKDYYGDGIHKSYKTLFLGTYDGDITPDTHEIENIQWLGRTKIIQEMKKRPQNFCPPFFEELRDIIENNKLINIFF